jgi:hypothetical protein
MSSQNRVCVCVCVCRRSGSEQRMRSGTRRRCLPGSARNANASPHRFRFYGLGFRAQGTPPPRRTGLFLSLPPSLSLSLFRYVCLSLSVNAGIDLAHGSTGLHAPWVVCIVRHRVSVELGFRFRLAVAFCAAASPFASARTAACACGARFAVSACALCSGTRANSALRLGSWSSSCFEFLSEHGVLK